jgi:hypothetical protein
LGEGDCDSDDDCLEGLRCGADGDGDGANCRNIHFPGQRKRVATPDADFSVTDQCCRLDFVPQNMHNLAYYVFAGLFRLAKGLEDYANHYIIFENGYRKKRR